MRIPKLSLAQERFSYLVIGIVMLVIAAGVMILASCARPVARDVVTVVRRHGR